MIEKRQSLLRRPRDNSLPNKKWKRRKLLRKLLKRLERGLSSKRSKDLTPPTRPLSKPTLKFQPHLRSSLKPKLLLSKFLKKRSKRLLRSAKTRKIPFPNCKSRNNLKLKKSHKRNKMFKII